MPKHRLRVTQVFRTFRTAYIEVEAEDVAQALELVEDGEIDLPSYDSSVWTEESSMENEEVDSA